MKNNIVTNYIKNCFEELTKVTWPTKNQAIRLTIIVFIFCFVIAIFLGAVDLFFQMGHSYLIDNVS